MTDRNYETGQSQAAKDAATQAQARVDEAFAQARAESGNNPHAYEKASIGKLIPIGVEIEIDHEGNKIGVRPNPEEVKALAEKTSSGRRNPF